MQGIVCGVVEQKNQIMSFSLSLKEVGWLQDLFLSCLISLK